MKVLITGATGFIGRHVAQRFLDAGYQVRVLVRDPSNIPLPVSRLEVVTGDIRDPQAVALSVQGCQRVVHTAALYTFWEPLPQVLYDVNVGGTRNIMQSSTEAGVERIVYTSTVSTVRFFSNGTLGTEAHDPLPKELAGHYKRSKYLAEIEVRRWAARGLPVVIVNPTAPVGPGDARPTPTGQTILDFLRGRLPAYIHTGLNLVDVADVAEGHLLAMEKGQISQRYILGNRNVTLKQLLEMLAQLTGKKAPRLRVPRWLALAAAYADNLVEGQILCREPRIPLEGVKLAKVPMWVDCSKALQELGLPQSPAERALEQSVRWYHDSGYVSRK